MDEIIEFESFVEQRGKNVTFEIPTSKEIQQFSNTLPDFLLKVWQVHGFGSYASGFFFISSPNYFNSILDIYFGKDHTYTVFCRTSFGDLLIWNHAEPQIISLDAASGRGIVMSDDGDINSFFEFTMDNNKFYDAHRYGLHLKAIKKFGQLQEDQVFGFFPALSLGGEEKLENIKVVQLREYLAMLAEIAVENNRESASQDE
jgi:hypothetical protein